MANDPENGKSTRLIVKNLPKHLNEKRLTTIFSKHGAVTDAKIIKRNKKSRLFGFIGYKDIETATEAKNYFDKTYIDTSKILVEFALKPSVFNNGKMPKN